MGKKAKLRQIKQEVAVVVANYDFAACEVSYSKDNRYAVICGIEKTGTPRVSVVAPGGMDAEEMHRITSIAMEGFKEAIDSTLRIKKVADVGLLEIPSN